MRDFKETVSANILALRTAAGMTQAELAEKLNYTDKAVSKWEHGEAMPDIGTLAEICRLFGVTMDALVSEPLNDFDRKREEEEAAKRASEDRKRKRTRIIITAMSVCLVWLIAVFVFITWHVAGGGDANAWLAYVYAVPVSAIVMLVLVSIWFRRPLVFISITALVWSVLASVYLSLLVFSGLNFWFVFLLGIPGQIIILLWWGMKGIR